MRLIQESIELLEVFFHVTNTSDNWLTLRENRCCFQVLVVFLFVCLANLYCLKILTKELLEFFPLDVCNCILKYHLKF